MSKTRLIVLSIILVVFTTITYSALATNLAITGEATIRAVSDIRVTDIDLDKAENDAVEEYAPKYTKNTITNGIKLPSNNSSISYTVEITNKGDIDEAIYGLNTVSNNSGLHILINGEEINSVLPMIIPYRTTREITITYWASTPSNETINIVNTFDFREVYYITYNTKGGSEIQRQIKYQNVDINLTQERPTKTGYVFTGWTDEQNGTQVKYTPGNLYTLNSNKTLYAIYRYGEATFVQGATFNQIIKQLANPNLNDITYETDDTNITSIQRYTSGVPSAATLANAVKVSTNTSEIDIYAWFSNGTIYYYTEAFNPYMSVDAARMFQDLKNATNIDLTTIDTSRTTNLWGLFIGSSNLSSINLSSLNTSNVINMGHLFNGCTNLTNITFGNNFNTSRVISMSFMFGNCSELANINLSNFNTSSVTNMSYMFYKCSSLTNLDISSFNTSRVADMSGLFCNCNSLESITFGNNFDTSNVTTMADMFAVCSNLQNIDLSRFNTSNVTSTWHMFYSCSSLTSLDISMFNMNKVTDVEYMLYNTTSLQKLKTPSVYPTDLTITLPKTLYDPSGNGYSTLSTGNPTQTWIKLGYTVVFNKNHNDATGTMANQIIQFDTATQLHANTYKRYGYVFTGWNTQANGSGTAYLNEASVTSLAQANGTITLYAQWREGEATFIAGKNFNIAIKQLANPTLEVTTHEMLDTNITSIQRYTNVPNAATLANAVVVSTQTSDYDIYVWYENGIIYYYSEAIKLYMNSSGFVMFCYLANVTNIDLSNIDTSRTIIMQSMFNNCPKLEYLDLSNFNTENVGDFRYMFFYCTSLSELDISSFSIDNVTDSSKMFSMLTNMNKIEKIKTPKVIKNGIEIDLPKTLYDELGNAYTTIGSTSPTKKWLRKAYTVVFDANGGNQISTHFEEQTITLSGSVAIPVERSNILHLESNTKYLVSFDYRTLGGTNRFSVDLYPDSLPQRDLIATTEVQHYDWIVSSENSDMENCYLRFFDDRQEENESDIIISNITLTPYISKEVIYNQEYGTMPSNPTRDGYQFVGWNGKNLLNYNNLNQNITGYSIDSNGLVSCNIYDSRGWRYENSNWFLELEAGTYTLNLMFTNMPSNEGAEQYSNLMIFDDNNNIIMREDNGVLHNVEQYTRTFTLNTRTKIGLLLKGFDGVYKIQLEEGNIATTWEPYYITSSTTVVQDKDHTLKAMWIPNTYTINYNGNGSTSGSTTSSTHTYDVASNLTTNGFKKYGYKFIGWNTAADGSGTAYLDGASVTRVGTSGTITLYAQWIEGEATFIRGEEFNVAIKELANPGVTISNQSYEDKNITSIQRYTEIPTNAMLSNSIVVSTNDSDYNIYAWYNNGTIYYYTEAINLYMNYYGIQMFRMMTNVTNIELSTIKTNRTFYMGGLFLNCRSLVNIDVSNFDTSNVISMSDMFAICTSLISINFGTGFNTDNVINMYHMFNGDISLTSIDLSTFNTERVNNMELMFTSCNKLKILDISNFNMSSVTNVIDMFTNMQLLEQLKTPSNIPSGVTMNLPKTLYDEDGNSYTQLDSTTPTEEWLRIKYNVTFVNNIFNSNSFTQDGLMVSYDKDTSILTLNGQSTSNNDLLVLYEISNPNFGANETYRNTVEYISGSATGTGVTTFSAEMYKSDGSWVTDRWYIDPYYATTQTQSRTKTINSTQASEGAILRYQIYFANRLNSYSFDNYKVRVEFTKIESKEVIYGQQYGILPTSPTKDGYQFAGWNGRNYYNYENLCEGAYCLTSGVTTDEDGWITINTSNNATYYNYWTYNLNLDENKEYMVIIEVKEATNVTGRLYLTSTMSDTLYQFGNTVIQNDELVSNSVLVYKRTTGTSITSNVGLRTFYHNSNQNTNEKLVFRISVIDVDESITTDNFKYEPYYITSSTTVVQDKNHTLKAVWTPNRYTINYNGNGNTSGTTASSTHTYDVSSNLTTNGFKKTGYTFIGWNTSADGTGTAYLDGASVTRVGTSGTVTLYAQWTKVNANNIQYNESEVNCTDVQCMIDELYYMLY